MAFFIKKILIVNLILSLIFCSSVTAFGAIENAFNNDISVVQAEYEAEYGWDNALLRAKEWETTVNGKALKCERKRGFQDYYLEDNIYSTLLTLGLEEIDLTAGVEHSTPKKALGIYKFAIKEVGTSENPNGSNKIKYNTWVYGSKFRNLPANATKKSEYNWNVAFVSWCIAKSGFIKDFKTNDITTLYNRLSSQNEVKQMSDSLACGGTYFVPTAGDVVFLVKKGNAVSVGIVASANNSQIVLIEGDKGGKVKKTTYKGENIPQSLKDGYCVNLSKGKD